MPPKYIKKEQKAQENLDLIHSGDYNQYRDPVFVIEELVEVIALLDKKIYRLTRKKERKD